MITTFFLAELKPEGYVPVSKHSVSPWELVEGAKGGCNVVPWQEIGGVRYDRQLDKMEVGLRYCVLLIQLKKIIGFSIFANILLSF